MRIYWLILFIPFIFTAEASEIAKKQLQRNLDKIFEHYEAETLTPELLEELHMAEVLAHVLWAISRMKANQNKILTRIEQATKDDSDNTLYNHLAAVIMLHCAYLTAEANKHPLEDAFDFERTRKALNHLVMIEKQKKLPL